MQSDLNITRISGGRAAVHNYYDLSPESPDGTRVAFFAFDGIAPSPGSIMVAGRDGDGMRAVAKASSGSAHRGAFQQWVDANRLAFHTDTPAGRVTVVVDLETGHRHQLPGAVRVFSPQGTRIAHATDYTRRLGGCCRLEAVYVTDFESEGVPVLTLGQVRAVHPLVDRFAEEAPPAFGDVRWAPDGASFFVTFTNVGYKSIGRAIQRVNSLFLAEADGSDLRYLGEFGHHPRWAPDGTFIYTIDPQPGGVDGLTARRLDGSAPTVLFAQAPGVHPSFSLDMKHVMTDAYDWPSKGLAALMLYDADGSGAHQVLARFAAPDLTHATGTHPHPAWSRDGRRIYFNAAEDRVPHLFALDL